MAKLLLGIWLEELVKPRHSARSQCLPHKYDALFQVVAGTLSFVLLPFAFSQSQGLLIMGPSLPKLLFLTLSI